MHTFLYIYKLTQIFQLICSTGSNSAEKKKKNKRSGVACVIIIIMKKSIDDSILLNMPQPDLPSQNAGITQKVTFDPHP